MNHLSEIFEVFNHAIVITGFVFVMMLVIEYINVQTHGIWQKDLSKSPWKMYLLAGLLGALPGCLGSFTAVALFSHRLISFGAIVTTMIATSGDEAFVMFAMMPDKALWITGLIVVLGIVAGAVTDRFYKAGSILNVLEENELPLHKEEHCDNRPERGFWHPTMPRLALAVVIVSLALGVLSGTLASDEPLWMRITLLVTFGVSLFVVITTPDHFIKEHLWDHIVKVHIPRIFLWTFGTLLVIHLALDFIDVQAWVAGNMLWVLLLAVLIGIVPESGPHLVFITLFVQGTIPFSILLASSIVQDGHGMLPMLAESKRGFIMVKGINILVGLGAGMAGLALGF